MKIDVIFFRVPVACHHRAILTPDAGLTDPSLSESRGVRRV